MRNRSHGHRLHVSYAKSLPERLYTHVVVPAAALAITIILIQAFGTTLLAQAPAPRVVFAALGATFTRLFVSYVFAMALAIPLALFVTRSDLAERVFLPLFDIMQSLPVLAFFPVIIIFFVHYGLYNGAAVFVLVITMLWSIVFSLVGGLRAIPRDVCDAGKVFGLRGFRFVRRILLPAAVPYLVTGSLLAFAGGWNIIIVAEVLHTYLPGSGPSADLFGIGSMLVNASAAGAEQTFLFAIVVLVAAIALLNLFVWQNLLTYAERFKFE